ncbi:hypothetical protein ACTQ4K_12600 [Clostridium sporogenes]|uniref:hypothetical protein n=1 Tax=Clostridium sporogenes TaxID=1509 RepID=UPI003F911F50
MLAMMVAMGVVISPILRIEGMCPMATLIGGTIAFVFLEALSKRDILGKIQRSLGAKVYDKQIQ